nr:glycoprotein vOX2-1 [Elephant endotheliotropic herpesvirus 1B]
MLQVLFRFVIGLIFISYTTVQGQVVTQDERELLNTPASLRCSLQTDKEVLIVTWQKINNGGPPDNMATFSENHGVVVQPPYKDRMNITQLGLRNSTITFWNTTVEDEGCFMCLFNTFGSGKISGKTCLTLYVPPTTSLHTDGLNITCSATARPAPVIFWKVAGSGIENSTKTVLHRNGTTAVTSVLQVKDPKSQVGNEEVICEVLHLGTVTDIRQTLSNGHEITLTAASIAVVVVVVIILIVIFCYNWRRRHRGGNTFHAL